MQARRHAERVLAAASDDGIESEPRDVLFDFMRAVNAFARLGLEGIGAR
jgi:hypothetical protein